MKNEKELLDEIERLKAENAVISRKLDVSQRFMQRELHGQIYRIAKARTNKDIKDKAEVVFSEEGPEIIAQRIQNYFGDLLLLNAPKGTISHLVQAEITFRNLQKNPTLDGLTVVGSYHKLLDASIEQMVTNDFRKFALKKGCTILRVNDPLEKALHLVITKRYILGVGRLYGLLKLIKNGETLYDFGNCFKAFLEKNTNLSEILLGDNFYSQFAEMVESGLFGSKRHSGSITLEETEKIRAWMVGSYQIKNSLLYVLLESQTVY